MDDNKSKKLAQVLTLTTLLGGNSSYFDMLSKRVAPNNDRYCKTCIVGRETPEACVKCDKWKR